MQLSVHIFSEPFNEFCQTCILLLTVIYGIVFHSMRKLPCVPSQKIPVSPKRLPSSSIYLAVSSMYLLTVMQKVGNACGNWAESQWNVLVVPILTLSAHLPSLPSPQIEFLIMLCPCVICCFWCYVSAPTSSCSWEGWILLPSPYR